MPPPAANEQYADLAFPGAGVDLSAEYELQTPGTTPAGTNVRAYEPSSGRNRGGSRPGLSRYVSTTVAGTHLIQHLNYIVDPTPRGLPAYTNSPPTAPTTGSVDLGGGLVPDPTEGLPPPVPPAGVTTDPSTNNGPVPRNPGTREPRDGGSGFQPNRRLPTSPPPPPPAIALVQFNYGPVPGTYTPGTSDFGITGGSARRTVTMPSHVADGNLLVCAVSIVSNPAATIQVRNGALASYTQAGTTGSYTRTGQIFQLSLWYRIASSGTQEDNVNVDMDFAAGLSVALLEFSHVLGPTGASLDGFHKNDNVLGGTSLSTGAVAVNLPGDVIVAAYSDDAQDVSAAGGTSAGYTLLVDQHDGTDMPSLYVTYRVGPAGPSETAVLTYSPNLRSNSAGATFKQA